MKKSPTRLGFSEKEGIIDLPNLNETQLKSFREFLQADKMPNERENVGLEEVFREIFPIHSHNHSTTIEYKSYSLGVPKYSPEDCIRRGITYNVTLKATFCLKEEGGLNEEEVYMGTMPIMTDKGTFIINGAERVIVSQLHRSPGISFEQNKHPKGMMIHSFRIIPYRGSWLEGSFDTNDHIYIYIDRKKRRRKILATTFLRAMGKSSDADIIDEFYNTERKRIKSEKDFPSLIGKILAQDVIDEETQVPFGKAAEKLTTAMLKRILDAGITSVKVIEDDVDDSSPIIKMLAKDSTKDYESALKEVYRKIRPGEPPTHANARSALIRLFFDEKRFNLGKVGRYKLNRKLGFSTSDQDIGHQKNLILHLADVIGALKYLLKLKKGDEDAYIDDIDHLGNRRVRSAGELIQNQCRIGLSRMEKIVKERLNLFDHGSEVLMLAKLISAKALVGVLKDFFGRSQLSQFMDQTNPVAELTHKRRLSALGPGGLTRDRAGFEVRDVHSSHYGRICPIETPEGPNIGLITSLASYAKINELGFVETPYRVVRDGVVTDEIEYMSADQEGSNVIAQASVALDEFNMFSESSCLARTRSESLKIETSSVSHMDVSSQQLFSITTALIPFLEHDDANRALMGSNMQRQAVPLLITDAPLVGTGIERRAAIDSGAVIVSQVDGVVKYVDANTIVVRHKYNPLLETKYDLRKFMRSNSGTCINNRPLVDVGDVVHIGDVLADGPSTDKGEIALGKNVLVAFMPWCGYNYEDAIIISEKLLREDAFTSIYLEEFELTARDTKLGKEIITNDIPNVSDEALSKLGSDGIIKIGSPVKPGDILVGKITPKSETELAPEERLLRAIFGEKAADVRDASLLAPPGTEGFVIDVKVFSRLHKLSKSDDEQVEETATQIKDVIQDFKNKEAELLMTFHEQLGALLLGEVAPDNITHRKTSEVLIYKGDVFTQEMLESIEFEKTEDLIFAPNEIYLNLKQIHREYDIQMETLQTQYKSEMEYIKKGDVELDAGVIKQVKVYVASKRKLQVGDKMAGRHGNKGVVSIIVPEADMPYLQDGTTVEIVLNPLGVPSRMNMGQLLETHLGFAAKKAGLYFKTPVFQSFSEEFIWDKMKEVGAPDDGKMWLYDGRTGERFDNRVVVGYIYLLKLSHLVADKIHARSIGPYSLVTQQPLGGKAQMGGQRFGEMEVWALEAYGAAYLLQEMLTVKSDDVAGRTRIYESIVKGNNLLNSGTPESFNVLIKEMKSLCLNVEPSLNDESTTSTEI